MHGPSVCAIGLQVDDATQALVRATAYQCQQYRGVVGPGELEIPAIRGLDDHLLYLVDKLGDNDTIWDVDFILNRCEHDSQTDVGLQRIDHLSQVITPGQLSTAVLFYHAIMNFEVAPQYDIVDPHGLIQSQVVETADRGPVQ